MSEFELISLFNEFFNTTFARLNDFMAGTFAMLVSAFFVGSRLSKPMAGLVLFLYTMYSAATIVPTLAASYRFVKTAELMRSLSIEHNSMINDLFPMLPSTAIVMPTMTVFLMAAYVGTIIFFLNTRKADEPLQTHDL